ncbi:transposase [Micromonospora sp. NPDC051196]|uniref:transposase n=1 Tax=Micromonospora sp. NPDC051196 TaxID=3155281 RepID=UPI00341AF774
MADKKNAAPLPQPSAAEVEFAQQLVERAKADGVSLVGPGGLLAGITRTVLESALDAELDAHLDEAGVDEATGRRTNVRNGCRRSVRGRCVSDSRSVADFVLPRDRRNRVKRCVPGPGRPSGLDTGSPHSGRCDARGGAWGSGQRCRRSEKAIRKIPARTLTCLRTASALARPTRHSRL